MLPEECSEQSQLFAMDQGAGGEVGRVRSRFPNPSKRTFNPLPCPTAPQLPPAPPGEASASRQVAELNCWSSISLFSHEGRGRESTVP